jgi:glycosyltransferase involved in cell wall biosynthesis
MATMSVSLSVVIPTLNEEKYLPNLLADLANQTYKDFEVIIIDAGSTDQTKKRAEAFSQKLPNFQFITADKKGVCHQKNLGAKLAKAPYVLFLDADDRIPNYYLVGLKFHQERLNPDFLSTHIIPDTTNNKDKAIASVINIYMDLQKNGDRPAYLEAVLLVRKTSFQKLSGFNENLVWGEGNDLILRAKKRKMTFCIVNNPKYTYSFRRLRKMGTINTIRRSSYLEIARKINFKVSTDKTKNLYPMEGGIFFEVNKDRKERIRAIVEKIIGKNNFTYSPKKEGGLFRNLVQRFYPR